MSTRILSVILLSYYSGNRIRQCYEKLSKLMEVEGIPFEFIVMDDGSKDDSYAKALLLEKEFDNVRAYQLSRNYTSMYSIFAGLSICKGSCATCIPDDEQQPYETLVRMYRLWEQGNKVIFPYREDRRDPLISRLFAYGYYWVMNHFSDIQFPPGGFDSLLIDREVIDILNARIHPINTSAVLEVLRLGFSPVYLPYSRPLGLNETKSRWTFKKKVRLAKNTFFTASTFPVQAIMFIGVLTFMVSLCAIVLYMYIAIWGNHQFWGRQVPGWTSLVLLILFFGGVVMLSLGMIAEYIWRIYDEVKGRPGFIIKKKSDNV